PVDSNPSTFAVQGIGLVKNKGCKKVAIIGQNNATAIDSAKNVGKGVESAGGQVVKSVYTAAGTPDFSPTVSSALGAGADCIGTALAPADLVKLITAVRTSQSPNAP